VSGAGVILTRTQGTVPFAGGFNSDPTFLLTAVSCIIIMTMAVRYTGNQSYNDQNHPRHHKNDNNNNNADVVNHHTL